MVQLRLFLLAILISQSIAASIFAQTEIAKPATDTPSKPEYRFVSTTKTSTFGNELTTAAKQGFRFLRLAKAFSWNIDNFLHRWKCSSRSK